MGFDLCSETGSEFSWSENDYARVLELAETCGWKPQGTKLPSSDEEKEGENDWPGYYLTNDYQFVLAEDAANMADALERTIEDISSKPVRTPEEKDVIKIKCPNGIMLDGLPLGYYDDWDAISYWGGQEARIGEFIEFLRLGSYRTD